MLARQRNALLAFFGGMLLLLGVMSLRGAIQLNIISLVGAPVFILVGVVLFWYAFKRTR